MRLAKLCSPIATMWTCTLNKLAKGRGVSPTEQASLVLPNIFYIYNIMFGSIVYSFFLNVCSWDKKPLRNRERVKVPLVGRVIEVSRRASMLLTHALMGFGKDPSM